MSPQTHNPDDLSGTPETSRDRPFDHDAAQHVPPGQAVLATDAGTFVIGQKTITPSEASTNAGPEDDLMITPGGVRLRSLVHYIPPGTAVDAANLKLRHVNHKGEVLAEFGTLYQRPSGKPLMPDNVNLQQIRRAKPDEIPATDDAPTKPAFGTGWITYASWTNNTGTPISSFSTTWRVPPGPIARTEPNGGNQIIFLFNGIQNSTMIYQPVLCWGSNGANTGKFWTVGSWYADGQGGPAFHSDFVRVEEGQILTGVIRLTGKTGINFNYSCEFEGIDNTSLPINNVQELTWAIETLECYGITGATSYPPVSATKMYNIALATGSTNPAITWSAGNAVTDCGAHTTVVDSSEVDLCYGTVAAPSTSVCSWGPNRLDVFGLGTDDGLWHAWSDVQGWGPSPSWESLGGIFLSTPSVVSWGSNRIDIFGIGLNHACFHKSWDGSQWSPDWEDLGGVFNSPITSVAWGPDRLDIFGLGTDNSCYHKSWDGSQWSAGWESLGGIFNSPIACVAWSPNRLDLFGLGTDNSCYHRYWDGSQWGPDWESLGGVFNSAVTVVSWGPGRLDIFGLGTDNALYHKSFEGGWGPSVSDWEYLGGVCWSPPAAVSSGADLLDIFVIGTDLGMYHKSWDGSRWVPAVTDFEPLGGEFNSNPVVTSSGPRRVDLFGLGLNNSLYTQSSNAFGVLQFNNWTDLGGIFDPA